MKFDARERIRERYLKVKTFQEEKEIEQEQIDTKKIERFLLRLSYNDFRILKKFYFTGEPFPNDTSPYTLSTLRNELKIMGIKISLEGLRQKLNLWVENGLLEKYKSFVLIYQPIKKIEVIREIIRKRIKEILP